MTQDKELIISDLRQRYCNPCTTSNSCAGCLVEKMEDAIHQPDENGCTEEYHKRIRNKGVTRCGSCFKSLHYLDRKGNS